MSTLKPYVGDVGTEIKLDTFVILSTATAQSIEAQRPDGTLVSWAATVVETTKVRYVTDANSFNKPGDWKLQARVVLPGGTWRGETVQVKVYAPFA